MEIWWNQEIIIIESMGDQNEKSNDVIRSFFKRWPTFYIQVGNIFGPLFFGGVSVGGFLKRFFPEVGARKILNLGSGPLFLRSDITNVDIDPYDNVDVVSSITQLSFADNSVDGVICDNVLEHVDEPQQAVKEMHRVMKPGAVGYISTPFLYPFHASPYDYQRWTAAGLEHLFKDFSEVKVGVRSGLFSTLNTWLCYVLPSFLSFGSDRVYWILVNISIFFFFPIKLLDIFANQLPFAKHTAAVFYCIIKK